MFTDIIFFIVFNSLYQSFFIVLTICLLDSFCFKHLQRLFSGQDSDQATVLSWMTSISTLVAMWANQILYRMSAEPLNHASIKGKFRFSSDRIVSMKCKTEVRGIGLNYFVLSVCYDRVEDRGRGRHISVQFLSFSCSFQQKLCQIIG